MPMRLAPGRLIALSLFATGLVVSGAAAHAAGGTFIRTGDLTIEHHEHAATLLLDGRVLVVGGESEAMAAVAELYDPATQTWTRTSSLNHPRRHHAATRLADGRVLVTGGWGFYPLESSTELFDPATGTWTSSGNLTIARALHRATLLLDGRVLVSGGRTSPRPSLVAPTSWPGGRETAAAEVYDPATATWTAVSPMNVPRHQHAQILLPNGSVLAVGGNSGPGGNPGFSTAEVFEPASGSWVPTGPRSRSSSETATVLLDGRVLVVGYDPFSRAETTAELYDPVTRTWQPTEPARVDFRVGATATPLADGTVLLAGGANRMPAELFDPVRVPHWSSVGPMTEPGRRNHFAALLNDGTVLFAGGREYLPCDPPPEEGCSNYRTLKSAELFIPDATSPAQGLTECCRNSSDAVE